MSLRAATSGRGRVRTQVVGTKTAAPLGPPDPNWNSVVSLLNFNGTNGDTTFLDSTGLRNWSNTGAPALSSTQSPFATTSLNLNGSSYITTPNTADMRFATGDFTVETWVYLTSVAANQGIVCYRNMATADGWEIRAGSSAQAIWQTSSSFIQSANSILTANTWIHIAASCASGTHNLYVSGVNRATFALTIASNTVASLTIGARTDATQKVTGYIGPTRITAGVARYTGSTVGVTYFTPPTAFFPTY